MTSTGDLKGCLRKLDAQLRALKYPREVDYNGVARGDPAAFLPVVSFAFISYSAHLAEHLMGFGVELTGKNDLRFIDSIYKVLRDLFHYKPCLTKQQFLQSGFAERKICVLCDIIGFALQKHKELNKGCKSKTRPRVQALRSDSRSEALPLQRDTVKSTDMTLSLSRPLVERHIGGTPPVSWSTLSDELELQEEEEEEEEEGSGLEEVQAIAPSVPQNDPVVEARLVALEAQLRQCQAGLGRLSALEDRLQLLEKASAGTITIDRTQWENLESRVLLLETKLALSTTQKDSTLANGEERHDRTDDMTDNSVTEWGPSPSENLHGNSSTGCDHPESSSTTASYPINPCVVTGSPEEHLKERLEKIANMMKDTSSLLRSMEPSM